MHVALLAEQALGEKLALAIPGRDARLLLLAESCELQLAAVVQRERVLGVASFHTVLGGLGSELPLRRLYARLGLLGALRAWLVMTLLGRREAPAELLLDGLIIARNARGRGLGRGLLAQVGQIARAQGCSQIRLDVIEARCEVRPDYERLGFEPGALRASGRFWRLLGFSHATSLVMKVAR